MKLRDHSSSRNTSGDGDQKRRQRKRYLLIEPPPAPVTLDSSGGGGGKECHFDGGSDKRNCQQRQEESCRKATQLSFKCQDSRGNMAASSANTCCENSRVPTSHHLDHHNQRQQHEKYGHSLSATTTTTTTSEIPLPRVAMSSSSSNKSRGALGDIGQDAKCNFNSQRVSSSSSSLRQATGGGGGWTEVLSSSSAAGYESRTTSGRARFNNNNSNSNSKSTKRKSELTSFLTILFGSLLAVLLLIVGRQSGNQILCSGSGGGALLRNVTLALPGVASTSTTAAMLTASTRTMNSSSSSNTALAPPRSLVVASASTTTTSVSPGSSSSEDYEASSSADEDANAELADGAEQPSEAASALTGDDGNPKTRLGDLINESASDGADLLINHLQASSATSAGATTNDASAESDSSEAGGSDGNGGSAEDEEGGHSEEASQPEVKVSSPRGLNNSMLEDGPQASPLQASVAKNGSSSSSSQLPKDSAEDEATGSGEFPASMDESTRKAMRVYAKWRLTADELIELFSRKLMPIVMEHGYDVDAGTVAGLLQVFNGIRQLKPWAVKLLDASFRLAPGVLVGTQSDFGDFDECLNIRVDDPSGLLSASSASAPGSAPEDDPYFPASQIDPLTGLKSTTLVGRYCLADIEFPKPSRRRHPPGRARKNISSILDEYEPIELRKPLMDFAQFPSFKDTIFVETGNFFHMLYVDPVRVGVCLTNKIDPQNFQQVVNKLLDEFKITINFRGRCVTKYDKVTWTRYQVVSAYVLLSACSLVLLSTLLDLLHAKLNKLPCPRNLYKARVRLQLSAEKYRPLFTSFSLIRNTRRLFRQQPQPATRATTGTGGGSSHTPALHGQRCAALSHVDRALTRAPSLSVATTTTTAASVSNCTTSSTSASSLADSSVESSPSIERRSSSGGGGGSGGGNGGSETPLASSTASANEQDLISLQQQQFAAQQHLFNNRFARDNCATLNSHHPQQRRLQVDNINVGGGVPKINLSSLHGIRVLTMTWMIVNHTYMFGGFFVLWAHRRLIDIAEWPKSLSFQFVLNGWLTVETYFFLSALIVVLSVMPLMRARKFSYVAYVLHRLVRLLPAYVGLVCLNFLWPLISSGPVWLVKGKSFVQTPCEQNLWTNFLFVNNWIWPEKQCMVHTWFLSADFQLYILAPIIVYLLYRRPALGHSLNLLVAICASVLSGFVIYANELLPTTLINKLEFDAIKQQLSYSYFATYQHMGPYCLGILTGYLLHKRPNARLPKHLTWLLWLLLPPLSFTTLLLTYLWNGAYSEPSLINPPPLVSATYVAIHRTIWTALVAWLVFACTTGRAKLLSSLLSHSLFLPISRLSYSIYLVHLPVIMFRSLNLRHTLEWTDQNILWEACGNFVVSLFMGFFLNLTFESPFINLENVFMRRPTRDNDVSYSKDRHHQINHSSSIFHTNKLTLTSNGANKLSDNSDENARDDLKQHSRDNSGFSTCSSSSDSGSRPESETSASDECQNNEQQQQQQQQQQRHSLTTRAQLVENLNQKKSLKQQQQPQQQDPEETMNAKRRQMPTSDSLSIDADLEKQEVTASSMLSSTISSRSQDGQVMSPSALASRSQLANNSRQQSVINKRQGRPRDLSPCEGEDQVARRDSMRPAINNRRAPKDEHDEHERSLASVDVATLADQDIVYSMTDEYRHYAPAGYQQWRRAMNKAALNQQQQQQQQRVDHNGQPASNNYINRPQQYATLARTSRAHRDPSMMMPNQHHYYHNQHHHQDTHLQQQRLQHEEDQFAQRYSNTNRSHLLIARPQRQFMNEEDDENNSQVLTRYERQLALRDQQESQVDVSSRRRRQGRYNTLTGTGTRDWRSQLAAHPRTAALPWQQQPQQQQHDLLSSWDAPSAWLANSSSNNGSACAGAGVGASLLIPRIDSATLRRQQARASSSLIGHPQQHQQQQQLESLESKIVEEPAAEESSAL